MAAEKTPLALYLHVPFCEKKCHYCDFLSGPADEETKKAYVEALVEECHIWKERLESYEIHSVFVGGGTPTCLSARQLTRLGEGIRLLVEDRQASVLEFTVEANPATLTEEKVQALLRMGVNRVSLGLQSANDAELKRLGRIHRVSDITASVSLLRRAGITNLNVDIMSALPEQTVESYRETLRFAVDMQPEHISAYSLIIEEGTPFYRQNEEGILSLPDEENELEMDLLTRQFLAEHGYRQYEISNYAKEGRECRHNITYWTMGQYLGLGLGAASFFAGERFRNTAVLSDYCTEHPSSYIAERHTLSVREAQEEFVFLGLRMRNGISMETYEKRFGISFRQQYADILPKLFNNRLMEENQTGSRIRLTARGMEVSNQILAQFLLD